MPKGKVSDYHHIIMRVAEMRELLDLSLGVQPAGTGTEEVQIGQRDSCPPKVPGLGIKKHATMVKDHESDACAKQ